MSAVIRIVPNEEWKIVKKYVNAPGIVLIPQSFWDTLSDKEKEYVTTKAENYDFGGEPAVVIDIAQSKEAYILGDLYDGEENEE